jgi:hypothetical protein
MTGQQYNKAYINGQWVPAASGATFDVTSELMRTRPARSVY